MAMAATSAKTLMIALMSLLPLSHCELIDLSHVQTSETFYFPGKMPYNRTHLFVFSGSGTFYDSAVITSSEHSGTHMDVPSHFVQGGRAMEEVPVEWTIADGVTIDCRKEAEQDRDYLLTVNKLREWEDENGRIPDRSAVLVQSGWSAKWENFTDYLGAESRPDPSSSHFPAVSEEAGRWLLEERKIQILGIDTLSPDPMNSGFPNHVRLLAANVLFVENLKIPGHMPTRGFRFHATPPKYMGATGTQVRAFAVTSYDYMTRVHSMASLINISLIVNLIGLLLTVSV